MSTRAFTDEQDRQLAAEYEAGATYRELARRYGGNNISVRSAVLRGGGESRPPYSLSNWSEEYQTEALALYRSGLSVKNVAKHFGCRTEVITNLLKDHDEVLKPGGKTHPKFRDVSECQSVAAAYATGGSLRALARAYGCTTPTIARAILRGGGTLRDPGVSKTWTSAAIEWTVEQYSLGRSQQSIAEALGVDQTSVSRRLLAAGAIEVVLRKRENHGSWKGGRTKGSGGYMWVLPEVDDLPYCTPLSTGYASEHRLVMGRALGRPLTKHETVHHINGDKADNRLENLQLRQGKHGNGVVMICQSCGSHDVKAIEIAT